MKWATYTMQELINEISMGPFGSDIKKSVYTNSGVPVLNGSNLQGFTLKENTFGYVSEEKADSLKKCNAHRGDIIVTHRGTLGQIVYIPNNSLFERYVISQSQFRFNLKPELARAEFIVYYFHTREGQHKILSNASQVGVPALARATTTFRQLEVKVPPLPVQDKIVGILSALDSKIENNNKINGNLEAQAQALFKSWFVDFTPFKDQPFIDSELGPIPQGWKVEKINDLDLYITDFVSNGSFASLKQNVTLYSDENYAFFIRNTDLKEGRYRAYVDKSSYFFLKKSVLHGGEIIISNVGDVGSVNLCPKLNKPMTLGNNIIMLKSEDEATHNFLYILFKWSYGKSLIKSITGGSAQPKFNKGDFKSLKIIMPTGKKLSDFNLIASSLLKKIEEFKEENQRLAALRDTLLPKLMSGEIKL